MFQWQGVGEKTFFYFIYLNGASFPVYKPAVEGYVAGLTVHYGCKVALRYVFKYGTTYTSAKLGDD